MIARLTIAEKISSNSRCALEHVRLFTNETDFPIFFHDDAIFPHSAESWANMIGAEALFSQK
jgi:hypothetical protein